MVRPEALVSVWNYDTFLLVPIVGEAFSGSGVVTVNELSLTTGSTDLGQQSTPGCYLVFVDCSQMQAGDQYRLRCLEKTDGAAAPQREVWSDVLTGPQGCLELEQRFALMHGWDFTLQKLAGVDRTFRWSIRG